MTSTGTLTNGDCLEIDSHGNAVDSGQLCTFSAVGGTSNIVTRDSSGNTVVHQLIASAAIQDQGLTTAGPVKTDASGNLSSEAQLAAVRGGTGIDTSASTGVPSISSGTWSVGAHLAVTLGGTNLGTLTAHGIVLGEGTSNPSFVGPTTAGIPLLSGGASADPSYTALTLSQATAVTGTLGVGNGGIGVANPTAHGVLVAEGSSAVTPVGGGTCTTGQLLTCVNSGNSDPAFQTSAATPRCELAYDSPNVNNASSNTSVLYGFTQRLSTGSCMTYTSTTESTIGDSISIVTAGLYAVNFFCGANDATVGSYGITINGSALTTNIRTTTYAQGKRSLCNKSATANVSCQSSWTGILAASDVIRFEGNSGGVNLTDSQCGFDVTQVSN